MDAHKPVPVVNLPPMRFIGSPTNQVITGNIQVAWKPEILVAAITTVGVPVDNALDEIGMKSRNVVIHLECGVKASWVMSLGELFPTQSVD